MYCVLYLSVLEGGKKEILCLDINESVLFPYGAMLTAGICLQGETAGDYCLISVNRWI